MGVQADQRTAENTHARCDIRRNGLLSSGGNQRLRAYITKIIASKADAVYFGGFGPDLINFVKQARAMGLRFPFLSSPLSLYTPIR